MCWPCPSLGLECVHGLRTCSVGQARASGAGVWGRRGEGPLHQPAQHSHLFHHRGWAHLPGVDRAVDASSRPPGRAEGKVRGGLGFSPWALPSPPWGGVSLACFQIGEVGWVCFCNHMKVVALIYWSSCYVSGTVLGLDRLW